MVLFKLNRHSQAIALASSLLENALDEKNVIEGRIFEETVELLFFVA